MALVCCGDNMVCCGDGSLMVCCFNGFAVAMVPCDDGSLQQWFLNDSL